MPKYVKLLSGIFEKLSNCCDETDPIMLPGVSDYEIGDRKMETWKMETWKLQTWTSENFIADYEIGDMENGCPGKDGLLQPISGFTPRCHFGFLSDSSCD